MFHAAIFKVRSKWEQSSPYLQEHDSNAISGATIGSSTFDLAHNSINRNLHPIKESSSIRWTVWLDTLEKGFAAERIAVSTNSGPDIALTIDLVPRIGEDNRRRRRETATNRGSRYRETSVVSVSRSVRWYGKILLNCWLYSTSQKLA